MKGLSFIYALDLFKRPLFLKINHQDMTSTNVGVFISVIIYGLLGYFFFQSDFFLRLQPTIITETSSLLSYPTIVYSNRPFAVSIKDPNNNPYVDATIFSILVESVSTTKGSSVMIQDVRSVHPCTQNDAFTPEDYLVLQNSFCLDNSNFSLIGGDSEDQCTNFQVHVIMCSNSTENNNSCKSQEEIDNFFIMKNFNLMYSNTVFQPKNYEFPFTTKLSAIPYKLDTSLSRLVTVQFQKATMVTDETVVFPVKNSIDTFLYENENSEYGMQSGGIPILSILFYSSTDLITINRSYQSLPEAFAVLGGLFSVFTICGRLILSIYNSLYITTLLMNFLYSFQSSPNVEGDGDFSPTEILSNRLPLAKAKSREIISSEKNNLDTIQICKESEIVALTENAKNLKTDIPQFSLEPISMDTEPPPILIKPPAKTHMEVELKKIQEKHLKEESLCMPQEEIQSSNLKDSHSNLHHSEPHINFQKEVDLCGNSPNKRESSLFSPITRKTSRRSLFKKEEKNRKSAENFLKLNEKENKINFNIWDYFKLGVKKLFFRGRTFKDKLFERAQEVFENEIDIVKILQKVQDIEKMKYLLLTDKQIALFNVLEKPMIFLPEDMNRTRKSLLMGFSPRKVSLKSQMNEAFSYYQELENMDVLDPVDKKLFVMVERRIKAYKKYFQNS